LPTPAIDIFQFKSAAAVALSYPQLAQLYLTTHPNEVA